MTAAVLPEAKELSPCVTLEVHDSGGHVGFVAAKHGVLPDYWLERRIPAFLSSHLTCRSDQLFNHDY
jgi:predicted alpha/beta-fold hydrolase